MNVVKSFDFTTKDKTLDKIKIMWYNKDTKEKEIMIMRYRVYLKDGKYMPTYFRTKREAIAYQSNHGGEIQRKIAGEWF